MLPPYTLYPIPPGTLFLTVLNISLLCLHPRPRIRQWNWSDSPLAGYVAVGKPVNFSRPQLTHLGNGGNNRGYLEEHFTQLQACCPAVGIFKSRAEFGTLAGMG